MTPSKLIHIAEFQRADATAEDGNALVDALFRLSSDGLLSFDHAGLVKSANPAFLRITGLAAGDVLGQPLEELERRLRQLAATPESWPGLEACFLPQEVGAGRTAAEGDGRRHLLFLQRPRRAALDLVGVAIDATPPSRLLFVRDVTREIEADRLKGEFLARVAHDLRAPMANIQGYAELLMSREFDAVERRNLLATVHEQTVRLGKTIGELVHRARTESRRNKDFRPARMAMAPLPTAAVATASIGGEQEAGPCFTTPVRENTT